MMSAQPQPATRNVGGRPPGLNRRRKELTQRFIEALGGPHRVTPLQRVEIERAASLTILAQEMRSRALRGEAIEVSDLTRLEGTADRAVRRLNLPASGAVAPVMSLHDHVARRAAERASQPQPDGAD
jgi:hypothetical protein